MSPDPGTRLGSFDIFGMHGKNPSDVEVTHGPGYWSQGPQEWATQGARSAIH